MEQRHWQRLDFTVSAAEASLPRARAGSSAPCALLLQKSFSHRNKTQKPWGYFQVAQRPRQDSAGILPFSSWFLQWKLNLGFHTMKVNWKHQYLVLYIISLNFFSSVSLSHVHGRCLRCLCRCCCLSVTLDRLRVQHIRHPHTLVCSQGNIALHYTSCICLSFRCILEKAYSKVVHSNQEIT